VLAIETSCDDTSVAVLERGVTLRSHLIAAQDVHRLYGGVVPELASRAHLELLPPLVEKALAEAQVKPLELTGVAVTNAPGLVGSLVVGVAFAKAYAGALGLPLIGVNHIEAHLHSASIEHGDSPLPAVALVVSGGHTELVEVRGVPGEAGPGDYRWLGATLDDAAGEAYDKVAKRLGLGFPGGPIIDKLAASGRADAYDFPRPMLDRPGLDLVLGAQDRGLERAPPARRAALPGRARARRGGLVPGGGGGDAGGEVCARPGRHVSPRAQPRWRRGLQSRAACRARGDVRRARAGVRAAHPVAAALRRQRGDDRLGGCPPARARRALGQRPRRLGIARVLGAPHRPNRCPVAG